MRRMGKKSAKASAMALEELEAELKIRDSLIEEGYQISRERVMYLEEMKNKEKTLKETTTRMRQEIEQAFTEKESMQKEYNNIEKHYKELNDEFERSKLRLRQAQTKKRLSGE